MSICSGFDFFNKILNAYKQKKKKRTTTITFANINLI